MSGFGEAHGFGAKLTNVRERVRWTVPVSGKDQADAIANAVKVIRRARPAADYGVDASIIATITDGRQSATYFSRQHTHTWRLELGQRELDPTLPVLARIPGLPLVITGSRVASLGSVARGPARQRQRAAFRVIFALSRDVGRPYPAMKKGNVMRAMRGYGQIEIPGITKPELPGYVTSESCAAQVGVLQKKWDDHIPMMIGGGIAAVAVGFFIGKAM